MEADISHARYRYPPAADHTLSPTSIPSPTEEEVDALMPDTHRIEPQPSQPDQGSAMSARLEWPRATMEEDAT
eukprot:12924502-Prorocentrum_lima.AAC.1